MCWLCFSSFFFVVCDLVFMLFCCDWMSFNVLMCMHVCRSIVFVWVVFVILLCVRIQVCVSVFV